MKVKVNGKERDLVPTSQMTVGQRLDMTDAWVDGKTAEETKDYKKIQSSVRTIHNLVKDLYGLTEKELRSLSVTDFERLSAALQEEGCDVEKNSEVSPSLSNSEKRLSQAGEETS